MRIYKESTVHKVFSIFFEGLCIIICISLLFLISEFFLRGRFSEILSHLISFIFLSIFIVAYLHYRIAKKRKKVFELTGKQQEILQGVLPIGILTVDLNKRITSWNSSAEEITGYASKEMIGQECKIFADYPCRDHCGLYDDSIKKPIKGAECSILAKDKSILRILKRADLIKDDLGNVIGGIECFEDITQRRAAEKKLKESEEKFRTVFENSAVAITVTDKEERIVSWNKYAEKILGRTKDELYLKNIKSFYPEDEWKRIRSLNIRASGYKDHLETVMLKGDGALIDVDISISVLMDSEGQVIGSIGVLRDISDRKRAEKVIFESEKRFRTIFENSAVSITVTDKEERIISWNSYTEKMLEKKHKDLYHKPISSLYEKEEWLKIRSFGLRDKGPQHHFESKMIKRDGVFVDVDVSVTILKDKKDQITGSLGIVRDITDRKKIENDLLVANQDLIANERALRNLLEDVNKTHAELKNAQVEFLERQKQLVEEHKNQVQLTEKAESAAKAKTEFLSNMSHEIRTPLNSIVGFSQLLRKTPQDEKQKKFVEIIEASSQHLLTIVNNILDFEKSIAGQIILDDTSIDMHAVARDVFRVLGSNVRDLPIEVGFNVSEDVPERLFGDETKLKQILMNLLSNALKFTKQGHVRLNVSIDKIEQEESIQKYYLRFCMEDTGVGIEPDVSKKVFEQFTQADSSTTRQFGGTGLGLSICKAYVELMGGNIWIESEKSKGSRFIFLASFHDHSKREIIETVLGGEARSILKGKKILLADNHRGRQEEFKTFFKEIQCSFDICEDGFALIEQIAKFDYQMCFVNVQLPKLSGVVAVKKIRDEINKTIPIIAIASATFFENREHCKEAGMDGFISTPLSVDQLKREMLLFVKKDFD